MEVDRVYCSNGIRRDSILLIFHCLGVAGIAKEASFLYYSCYFRRDIFLPSVCSLFDQVQDLVRIDMEIVLRKMPDVLDLVVGDEIPVQIDQQGGRVESKTVPDDTIT